MVNRLNMTLAGKLQERLRTDEVLFAMVCVGATLAVSALPAFGAVAIFIHMLQRINSRIPEKNLRQKFYVLKRQSLIKVVKEPGRTHLVLTRDGNRHARLGGLILGALAKRKRQKFGQWYILMFDVWSARREVRDALRYFLKRMGFIQLQKSVWVCPYDCREEVRFLRSHFKLPEAACRLIVSSDIGDDSILRKLFSV